MGSSESTKRLTVERPGEDGTPGIVKASDDFSDVKTVMDKRDDISLPVVVPLQYKLNM